MDLPIASLIDQSLPSETSGEQRTTRDQANLKDENQQDAPQPDPIGHSSSTAITPRKTTRLPQRLKSDSLYVDASSSEESKSTPKVARKRKRKSASKTTSSRKRTRTTSKAQQQHQDQSTPTPKKRKTRVMKLVPANYRLWALKVTFEEDEEEETSIAEPKTQSEEGALEELILL